MIHAPMRTTVRPTPRAGRASGPGRALRLLAPLAAVVLVAGCTSTPTPPEPGSLVSPAASPAAPQAQPTAAATPSEATGAVVAAAPTVLRVGDLADKDWVSQKAAATGIPSRVLASYAGAALAITPLFPSCHLGWDTLAGIGEVESAHGTVGGSSVNDAGFTVPAIIGVALDGNGVGRIVDTDSGKWDNDRTWDRAVGPMQLLPANWAEYGQDGNGDGVADPQQIDDATYTAAYYLCGFGDLNKPDTWIDAVAAYNQTLEYNHAVVKAVNRYAAAG